MCTKLFTHIVFMTKWLKLWNKVSPWNSIIIQQRICMCSGHGGRISLHRPDGLHTTDVGILFSTSMHHSTGWYDHRLGGKQPVQDELSSLSFHQFWDSSMVDESRLHDHTVTGGWKSEYTYMFHRGSDFQPVILILGEVSRYSLSLEAWGESEGGFQDVASKHRYVNNTNHLYIYS